MNLTRDDLKKLVVLLQSQCAAVTSERDRLKELEPLWIAQNEDNYADNKRLQAENFEQFETITLLEKERDELKVQLTKESREHALFTLAQQDRIAELETELSNSKTTHAAIHVSNNIQGAIKTARRQAARECVEIVNSWSGSWYAGNTLEAIIKTIRTGFGMEKI